MQYHWVIIHLVDLVAISLMIMGRGGIHSECFNLYYLVILQAGLVFGVKQALISLLFSSLFYFSSVMLTGPTEAEIRKLIVRLMYSWLVGTTGSYLAYLQKKHQKQAMTDFVTRTYNRSFLEQSLNYEYNRAVARKSSLSLIMIDIDNFKAINDRFGHQNGDRVLESVAKIIKSNIREVDFVARYGGEEFIVTLPGMETDKAWDIAERIRKAVERARFGNAGEAGAISVTISCGLASYPVQARNLDELVKKADEYLYEAKNLGRNRVYSKAC